jgi:hypothetical protein
MYKSNASNASTVRRPTVIMQVDHIIIMTNIMMSMSPTRDIGWKDDIHAEYVELSMERYLPGGTMSR